MVGCVDNLQFGMDGTAVLSFRIANKQEAIDTFNSFHDKDLVIKVSRKTKKRSLDANAYCWVLIGKLAAVLNVPTTDIYRHAIREIGGNYTVVCTKNEAVETLRETWQRNGLGWLTDITESKIKGCTNVLLYQGSSTYDTHTMSRLIDYIVSAAKENGIETMTPAELAGLKERWK